MTELVINVPEELKKQAEESNIDLSKLLVTLIKREVLKQILLKRFKSKELSTEKKEELSNKLSSDKRKEILSE